MNLEIIKASVLGAIQGITEWLPISSTAHLLIFERLLNVKLSEDALKLFLVVIQLGSVLALIIVYFKTLWPFKRDKIKTKESFNLWGKIIVAALPAAILGLLLDKISDRLQNFYVIDLTLFIYGVLYIIVEWRIKKKNIQPKINNLDEISYLKSFELGLFQSLAIIPGTSRSGSTILGGLLLGLSRETATTFSFFMALPVIVGASLLRVIKYFAYVEKGEWVIILIGTVFSFIFSLLAVKGLIKYLKKHDFTIFGIYRILLAFVIIIFFLK